MPDILRVFRVSHGVHIDILSWDPNGFGNRQHPLDACGSCIRIEAVGIPGRHSPTFTSFFSRKPSTLRVDHLCHPKSKVIHSLAS